MPSSGIAGSYGGRVLKMAPEESSLSGFTSLFNESLASSVKLWNYVALRERVASTSAWGGTSS